MKIVCQLDQDGRYVGQTYADPDPLTPAAWLIPGDCIDTAPPTISNGQEAWWVDGGWEMRDISAPAIEDAPPPSDPIAQRRAEILGELATLDAASARPLRALALGTATDADQARLAELDARAASLRQELATLK